MKESWQYKFLELAKHISAWSKDKNAKIGAIIVDDNRIVSVGYNGFPTGVDDTVEERFNRPKKYLYTEHAERNAIYNAARTGAKTKDCTMVLTWFPCSDCARAIIQSGITSVICEEPDFNDERWGETFKVSFEMMTEAKINLIYSKI